MRRLDPAEVAERFSVTMASIASDYEAGKLSQGASTHPVKKLDDDWDPELGITNENMMRLLSERLQMQGILVYFSADVARETIIEATGKALKAHQ